MRSDYILYVVAIIFFAITAISFAALATEFERNLSVVSTAVLGLLFLVLGYTQRPRMKTSTIEVPTPPHIVATAPVVTEPPKQETPAPTAPQAKPLISDLTLVKGIKVKRADQLKALGINTVQDLASASAEKLSKELKVASYFPEQWIKNAKELIEKS